MKKIQISLNGQTINTIMDINRVTKEKIIYVMLDDIKTYLNNHNH